MAFGSAVNASHWDANQNPSITGVIGTLGTADVGGTSLTLPIGVDPSTGALYVNNLGASSSGGSNVNVFTGTQQTLGTVGTVLGIGGTVAVSGASSGTYVNIATGSQQTLGTVGTVLGIGGTVAVSGASSGTNVNVVTGTLNVGTVAVTTGTMVGPVASGGSETGAPVPVGGTDSGGTVRLPLVDSTGVMRSSGSQVITVGTISVLPNIPGGTLGVVSAVSMLNAGTLTTIPNIPGGTLGVVSSVTAIAAGTQNTLGTVGVVNNGTLAQVTAVSGLTTGTITTIAAGTQNTLGTVGVVNNGTITINNKQAGSAILTTQTQGTTGAAVWGTLIAPVGAGTYVYVNGLSVVVASGTVDVAITTNVAGSAGANVLTRGQFVPGGGIMRDFFAPIQVGTNGTIAYWLGGAGTVSMCVNYWVGT